MCIWKLKDPNTGLHKNSNYHFTVPLWVCNTHIHIDSYMRTHLQFADKQTLTGKHTDAYAKTYGQHLAQVMACCPTALCHSLNPCWLIVSKILRHSPGSNFTAISPCCEFKNCKFNITATSLRGQWVKSFWPSDVYGDLDLGQCWLR